MKYLFTLLLMTFSLLSISTQAQIFKDENSVKGEYEMVEVKTGKSLGQLKLVPYNIFYGELDFKGILDGHNESNDCYGEYEMIWNVISVELHCISIRQVNIALNVATDKEMKAKTIKAELSTAKAKIPVLLKRL